MCPNCGGDDEVISEYCTNCRGEEQIQIKKNIKVKVPPGVSSGSILRVAGEGDAGPRWYATFTFLSGLSLLLIKYFIGVTCKTTFLFITYLQCTKLQIEFLVSEMENLKFMLFIHPYG